MSCEDFTMKKFFLAAAAALCSFARLRSEVFELRAPMPAPLIPRASWGAGRGIFMGRTIGTRKAMRAAAKRRRIRRHSPRP